MTRHSSIIGGSNADRILSCPGSYQATLALPPSADVSSEYALEGTAMHAVMDHLMRARQPHLDMFKMAQACIGRVFEDRALTQDHLDTMISPALEALEKLEDHYGGGFEVLGVESRVAFPGVPAAYGTIDLILASKSHVLHVDWKFGQGVGVHASYIDGDGEKLNPQLMYYLAASMHTNKRLYKPASRLVIAIIQPRTEPALTDCVVTKKDVKWFIEDTHNAIAEALSRNPPLHRGEHCRWCPAKISCPKWTGPMLDLSALMPVQRTTADAPSRTPSPYGIYLANAKALVDMLAMFKKEIDDQLHGFLEDGGVVPGWRLKAKTKQRQWLEDNGLVAAKLHQLGFKEDEIWQRKLQTFQSADATAKRLGVKIPDDLRVAPPTNETTVARTDDPAPVVERQLAIEQFQNSLKLLLAEKTK